VSRWQWLFKLLLAIPHFIVLLFLWIGFVLSTVVAGFAILFTGYYPRRIFDFNVGVLRWSWRVGFYTYSALGSDKYPPSRLPMTLPTRLSSKSSIPSSSRAGSSSSSGGCSRSPTTCRPIRKRHMTRGKARPNWALEGAAFPSGYAAPLRELRTPDLRPLSTERQGLRR
jgi:hypothetical protein